MRLEGKTAIITGGARGIGAVTGKIFSREGAAIAVVDLDPLTGERLCEELDGPAMFFKADVSNQEEAKAMVEAVKERFGRIDVLVNNAGITRDAMLSKMTKQQWDSVISVNLTGVFNCGQAVVPVMLEQRWGRIINTSSVVGLYGNYGQTNYAAAKAGIIGMTKTWARELGRKGILVNAVAPGYIETEMTASVPEKILDQIRKRNPLQRLGRPEEVAYAYLFLASDESSYVNGMVLEVDGGYIPE